MNNDPNDRRLDQTDEEILTSGVSDEALEWLRAWREGRDLLLP